MVNYILYEGIKKRDKKIIFESFVNQPLCSSLTLDEARSLFDEMYEKKLLQNGDKVIILGYGGGLNTGSILMEV